MLIYLIIKYFIIIILIIHLIIYIYKSLKFIYNNSKLIILLKLLYQSFSFDKS